jgi:hypothetical protein
MKKNLLRITLVLACSTVSSVTFSWGWWSHKEIHRFALQSLPAEMRPFFDVNGDSIIERAVDADRRVFVDKKEQPYHFIDIDRYGKYPFAELPRSYAEAVKKFGKETVDSNGTVPWRIADFTERLTEAMKRGDRKAILFFVSNLGHYVADAHVPLHSTENYNGQLSNQLGIHSRWETQLPEQFGKRYKLEPVQVEYIKDPVDMGFTIILESYQLVDSVLAMERKAREGIPESDLFTTKKERGRTVYLYSEEYYNRYHKLLNGMVERRMKDSIRRVASFWYTAWMNAGKPDLPL